MRAAEWAKNKLTSWGFDECTLRTLGEFGKGWEQERCYVAIKNPYYQPLIAVPKAWTGSTPGTEFSQGMSYLLLNHGYRLVI